MRRRHPRSFASSSASRVLLVSQSARVKTLWASCIRPVDLRPAWIRSVCEERSDLGVSARGAPPWACTSLAAWGDGGTSWRRDMGTVIESTLGLAPVAPASSDEYADSDDVADGVDGVRPPDDTKEASLRRLEKDPSLLPYDETATVRPLTSFRKAASSCLTSLSSLVTRMLVAPAIGRPRTIEGITHVLAKVPSVGPRSSSARMYLIPFSRSCVRRVTVSRGAICECHGVLCAE